MTNLIASLITASAVLIAVPGAVPSQPAQLFQEEVEAVGGPGAIDRETANALRAALEDERRAQAFYRNVMVRYGPVRPFVNIEPAEAQHAQAIITLMRRYGVPVNNQPPSDVPAVAGTLAGCKLIAAQAERNNIALYNRLIPTIVQPDIRRVFENLRAVSLNSHLPAFLR